MRFKPGTQKASVLDLAREGSGLSMAHFALPLQQEAVTGSTEGVPSGAPWVSSSLCLQAAWLAADPCLDLDMHGQTNLQQWDHSNCFLQHTHVGL